MGHLTVINVCGNETGIESCGSPQNPCYGTQQKIILSLAEAEILRSRWSALKNFYAGEDEEWQPNGKPLKYLISKIIFCLPPLNDPNFVSANEVRLAIHLDDRGYAESFEIFRMCRTVGSKDMRKNAYMTVILSICYFVWCMPQHGA